VEYVRETYLTLPDKSIPYNLTHNNMTNPSEGQVQSIWNLFENVTTGDLFFVDCGANDGEYISNTLWLEKEKGWNGLLIEADPTTFGKLKTKHRKAWHANLCLSTDRFPKTVSFFRNLMNSGVNGLNKRRELDVTREITVQCIPLYTMLRALNRTVIDFFSLDIEGLELEVLKTIPFDKILIKTLAIEHWSIPGGAAILERFMKQKGYYLHERISTSLSQDSIFIHNSLHPVPVVGPNKQVQK